MVEKRLSEMKPREKGIIVTVVGGPPSLKKRILDMGLVRNTEIEVIRNAPLGDPVEFRALGYDLCLRKDEARYVVVRVEKES